MMIRLGGLGPKPISVSFSFQATPPTVGRGTLQLPVRIPHIIGRYKGLQEQIRYSQHIN